MEINLVPGAHITVDERFQKLYSFTTENISGFFDLLPHGKGSALTICGSGDHIINLALSGKETITAIDINREALCFAILKLTALNLLSLEEFLTYFMKDDDKAFSFSIFERLRPCLLPEVAHCFETKYAEAAYDGLKLRLSLFNLKHASPHIKQLSNPYLKNAEAFSAARENLKNARINLYCCAAQTTDFKLPGSPYDVILLSNLADHAPKYFKNEDPLGSFVERVVKPAICNLRAEGKLFAAYLYDVNDKNKTGWHSAVDDPHARKMVLARTGMFYREHLFESVIARRKDGVVILEN